MMQTESGPRQGGSDSVRGEEAKIISGKYRPRDLRIELYDRVIALRQRGLSYSKIRDVIKQEYGIELNRGQISEWVRGVHSPYNGWRGWGVPSLKLLEPSEDLAYVIGVVCGDGYVGLEKRHKGYGHSKIRLIAKDKEFVEEFAIRIGRVLNRPPPKLKVQRTTGYYCFEAESKTLYKLLKKPIDLERLRKYIEHCDGCITTFLRGFFDSEGSVAKTGSISVANSDYNLLRYVQSLLRRFEILTTGPHLLFQRGTIKHSKGKQYICRRDIYYVYVRRSCNIGFYKHIGFTIKRKQERLLNYLRRTGRLEY